MKCLLRSGDLDRRITILQRAEVVRDEDGSRQVAWLTLATVRAQVQDILPGGVAAKGLETVEDGISMLQRPCRIRIRYRDDITSEMRVQFGARILRITSAPAEIGRRVGLEFTAVELSSEGAEP